MTKIILTRHGETIWNIERKVQGMMDSSLTENGLFQAEKLAKRLRKEGITRVFSSDLPRAVTTARIIVSSIGIKDLSTSPFLREISFGEWEGRAWEELREEYPEHFKLWDNGPHQVVIPGGETMQSVSERSWNFIIEMVDKYPCDVLCFVTHGMTLQLLIKRAMGYPIDQWDNLPWQHNTALNILEMDTEERVSCVLIADCSHLNT